MASSSSPVERYVGDPLWPLLVEAVKALPSYPYHKDYVRSVLLRDNPNITPEEVKIRLGIPLGEAIVILHELSKEKKD
ncbi:MAG: hypothetical protein ACXQTF_05090 [Candidatus Hecatellaceae archaeon]|nr:MAG: hypothetical protein DRO43_06820 [Candidatus Hecatellales archaeon]